MTGCKRFVSNKKPVFTNKITSEAFWISVRKSGGAGGKLRYKPKGQSFHQKSVEKIKIAVLKLGAVAAHL